MRRYRRVRQRVENTRVTAANDMGLHSDTLSASFQRLPAGRYLEVLVASAVISVLSLALPLAMLQIYDRILPAEGYATTNLIAAAVLGAIALESLMRIARTYVITRAAAEYEHEVGTAAFKHFLLADMGAIDSVGPGEHLERFNAPGKLRDFYSGQAVSTVLDLVFAIVFLGVMFYLGGYLAFVPVLLIGILVIALGLHKRALGRHIAKHGQAEDSHSSILLSILDGLQTARAFGMERLLLRRSEAANVERTYAAKSIDDITQELQNLAATLTQMGTVCVVALGAMRVMDGSLTVGGLAACTMLTGRALQPCQGALGLWTRVQHLHEARGRLDALFGTPQIRQRQNSAAGGTAEAPASATQSLDGARLAFDNVGFHYPDCPALLRDINFEVAPGEAVAITGPNNSGKSTLLYLMKGLLSPSSGAVLVDGIPIDSWSAEVLRSDIVLVPQHDALTRGTILENLTLYRPEYEARALAAADYLDLSETIHGLPDGFHTRVGEGAGKLLPRGVVQRIALARALVGTPRALLFDAANTAVDDPGDMAIKKVFQQLHGRCTVIFVSHRPSYLWLADRVHDLRNGLFESSGLTVSTLQR